MLTATRESPELTALRPASEQAQDRPAIGDLQFYTIYKPDPEDEEKLVGEDWVSWLKIGDTALSRTEEKVSRLAPDPTKVSRTGVRGRKENFLWKWIEPAYRHWKENSEIPDNGTPLESWPGCDPMLAKALRDKKIRTVEDFAQLPDHALSTIPMPSIRKRQQAARTFLESRKGREEIAQELQKRDADMADMRKLLEEQAAMIAQLQKGGGAKSEATA